MPGAKALLRLTTAAAAFGLAVPGVAPAKQPPRLAGLWQYVEMVPTASGAATEIGGKRRAVPPTVAKAIGSAPTRENEILRAVATSAAYGAPPAQKAAASRTRRSSPNARPAARLVSAPVRAGSLFDPARDTSVAVLLVSMLLSLVAAVAWRLAPRRHQSPAS